MKTKMKAAKTKSKTVKALRQTERVGPRGTVKKKGKGPEMLTEGNKGNEGMEDGAGLAIKWVLRKEIRPDAEQPRKNFEKGKLEELAASIKAVGIRAPLQVEWVTGLKLLPPDLLSKSWSVEKGPKILKNFQTEAAAREFMKGQAEGAEGGFYKIVDGERRWRAAEMAGVERVPVMVVDTSAPDWEKKKLAIQVVLNQQHENLSALEEAAAYGREIESGRHTAESLWKAVGISRSSLFGRLALNKLQPKVREALVAGRINTSVANLVAMVPDAKRQEEFMEEIAGDELNGAESFRGAQSRLEQGYCRQLKGAEFSLEKEYVWEKGMESSPPVKTGGTPRVCVACVSCAKRSGNIEGFPEATKRPNVCTNPVCFEGKTKAHRAGVIAAAEAQGKKVLPAKESEKVWYQYGSPGQLPYGSPYVTPDGRCGEDGKSRNYRTLLKGLPEAVWAVTQEGKLAELWPKEAVGKALKEKGFKFELEQQGESTDWKKEQKERQEKVAALEKVAAIAKVELLEKVKAGKTDAEFLRIVAREVCSDYTWRSARGVEDDFGKLVKFFGKLDEASLRVCLVEVICQHQGVKYDGSGFKEEFALVCETYGVDLKRVPVEGEDAKKK